MERTEALKQIDEINKIIQASNKVIFSGSRMILYGVLVLLIPAIEKGTVYLTFGYNFGEFGKLSPYLATLIHIGFYWLLFGYLGKLVTHYFNKKTETTIHPLIDRAFSLYRPIVVAIIGIVSILAPMGEPGRFIFPMVYILLGILFNLYGRFSLSIVTKISWSYIIFGLAYLFLTQFHLENLWMGFTTYLGLSYIVMGYTLNKEQAVS